MFDLRIRKLIEDLKVNLPTNGVYSTATVAGAAVTNRLWGDVRRMLRLFIGDRDGMGYSSNRRRYDLNYIEEQVTLGGASQYQLVQQLPPNSLVESVQLNIDMPVTLATAVKLGVGTAAAVGSELLLTGTIMTKNYKYQNRLGLVVSTAPNYTDLKPWYPAVPAAIGTSMVRASGVTTVTATHSLKAGDMVRIIGATDSSFNGDFKVATITSTTAFTFAQPGLADATAVVTAAYLAPWIKLYLTGVDNGGTLVASSLTSGKVRVGILFSHVSDLQDYLAAT
jgi:hypothetical protein